MRRISFAFYALVVSGFAAWTASSALARPVITSQPQSVTATEGAEIMLRVAATGTEPLAYQWSRNNTPIPGATGNELRLTTAGPADVGSYRVVVTDESGTIPSVTATVTLTPPPGFLWSRGGGTQGIGAGGSVATDDAGNVYLAGYFSGSATFGTSNLVCPGTHFFVARYDAAGNLAWVRQGGGAGDARAHSLALDAAGNVLVTGSFTEVAAFDGVTLTSAGLTDGFIAKYDSAGSLVWARRLGDFGSDQANGVAVDGSGAVWVTGSFENTVSFGATSLTSFGGSDVFVAKYDGNGNAVWAKRAGGTQADMAQAIGVDAGGNIYVAGYFNDVAYFDTETVTVVAQVNKTSDLFVAKYRSDGSLVWVRRAGGVSSDNANALALDGGGNVFLAGKFFYTATFGNLSVTASGGGYPEDFFVAKYSPEGEALWVRSGGSNAVDVATSVATDAGGNAYVVGWFSATAVIGGTKVTSSGSYDGFVAAYSAAGDPLWVRQVGGTGADVAQAVAAAGQGNLYVTGGFAAPSAKFGHQALTTTSPMDYFLTKLAAVDPGAPPSITLQPADQTVIAGTNVTFSVGFVGSGLSYQWHFNGVVLSGATNPLLQLSSVAAEQSGDYSVVITNTHGAVTSAVARLTVSMVPMISSQPVGRVVTLGANVSLKVGAISSLPMGYQWMLNGSSVPGATNATLAMNNMQYAQFGAYAAIVSNTFGAVTSATALVTADLVPEVLWAVRVGGPGDDVALATAVDATTNVYLAGQFSGTVPFGSSNLVSSGGKDVFLAKYDSAGRLLWARQAGGELQDVANSVAIDPAGNLVMVGDTESSILVFDNWVLRNNYPYRDLFVAKYDSAGRALWACRAGGTGYDEAKAVATDRAGNVYVTGSYFDAVLLGNIGLTNRAHTNFFLAKFGPDGNVLWARTTAGANACQGNGVAVDAATNVYVTGSLLGWADFGSGSLTNTNTYLNGTVFVAKYNSEGTPLWVRKGPTSGIGFGQAIAVDNAGELYATSYKRDYGTGYLLTRYGSGGNVRWYRTNAISCCTGDATFANGLALDPAGNPVLTGSGNGSIQDLTNWFSGGYVLKYRSDGEGVWIQRCGTAGNSVAQDDGGNLYVAGRFTGQGFFGASNLVSAGGNDAFLVKFGVRPPAITVGPASQRVVLGSSVVLRVSATGSGPLAYQWQFNGVNLAQATGSTLTLSSFKATDAGRYSAIVQNTSGCVTSQVAVLTFVPKLDFTRNSDGLILSWPGTFTLQTATNVVGPYEDVTSAPNHYTNWIGPGAAERFFRLRAPAGP